MQTMDFPLYHLDFLGDRLLIALIAILHVVISHSLAVGGLALVAWMERKGLKDPRWEQLAKKVLFVFFIITTSIGALTGVGIWLSASLVNPTAIGSLIRVFFWAWFTEWIVFVTEVSLILVYYLTWEHWLGERKTKHVRLGFFLALASWLTMVIIVAILAFMMDPGSWHERRSLLSGVLNPVYLPQLAFRTPLAMTMAGGAAFFILAFLKLDLEFRQQVTTFFSKWTLFWFPFLAVGSFLYFQVIPQEMKANMSVALTTQEFASWYKSAVVTINSALGCALLISLKGLFTGRLPRFLMVAPFVIYVMLMGQFERAREFIRKPFAIGGYLYANGLRKDDYPLLQKQGLLQFAPYASVRHVTPENEAEAGREVFKIACTRCHTVNGVNSVRDRLQAMYGDEPWQTAMLAGYLLSMHQIRPFMPPFPGNDAERLALAKYLVSLQAHPISLEGVQTVGVSPASQVSYTDQLRGVWVKTPLTLHLPPQDNNWLLILSIVASLSGVSLMMPAVWILWKEIRSTSE